MVLCGDALTSNHVQIHSIKNSTQGHTPAKQGHDKKSIHAAFTLPRSQNMEPIVLPAQTFYNGH